MKIAFLFSLIFCFNLTGFSILMEEKLQPFNDLLKKEKIDWAKFDQLIVDEILGPIEKSVVEEVEKNKGPFQKSKFHFEKGFKEGVDKNKIPVDVITLDDFENKNFEMDDLIRKFEKTYGLMKKGEKLERQLVVDLIRLRIVDNKKFKRLKSGLENIDSKGHIVSFKNEQEFEDRREWKDKKGNLLERKFEHKYFKVGENDYVEFGNLEKIDKALERIHFKEPKNSAGLDPEAIASLPVLTLVSSTDAKKDNPPISSTVSSTSVEKIDEAKTPPVQSSAELVLDSGNKAKEKEGEPKKEGELPKKEVEPKKEVASKVVDDKEKSKEKESGGDKSKSPTKIDSMPTLSAKEIVGCDKLLEDAFTRAFNEYAQKRSNGLFFKISLAMKNVIDLDEEGFTNLKEKLIKDYLGASPSEDDKNKLGELLKAMREQNKEILSKNEEQRKLAMLFKWILEATSPEKENKIFFEMDQFEMHLLKEYFIGTDQKRQYQILQSYISQIYSFGKMEDVKEFQTKDVITENIKREYKKSFPNGELNELSFSQGLYDVMLEKMKGTNQEKDFRACYEIANDADLETDKKALGCYRKTYQLFGGGDYIGPKPEKSNKFGQFTANLKAISKNLERRYNGNTLYRRAKATDEGNDSRFNSIP